METSILQRLTARSGARKTFGKQSAERRAGLPDDPSYQGWARQALPRLPHPCWRAQPRQPSLALTSKPDPRLRAQYRWCSRINGKQHRLTLDPRVTLLDVLRENLQMPGTKKGCDHGQCGACTVHVNGRRVNSCLTFAVMHQSDEILTIEGLAQGGKLHPVQEAFLEHDGFQCGYCTSGQIMSGAALLKEPVGPDDASVREFMSGNLCRCGAYNGIVAAVQEARRKSGGS